MIGIYAQEELLYPSFQLGGRNCTEVGGFGGGSLGREGGRCFGLVFF